MSSISQSEAVDYLLQLSSNYSTTMTSVLEKKQSSLKGRVSGASKNPATQADKTQQRLPKLAIRSLTDPTKAFCEKPSLLKRAILWFFNWEKPVEIDVKGKTIGLSLQVKNYDKQSNLLLLRTLFRTALEPKTFSEEPANTQEAAKLHDIITFALQIDHGKDEGSCTSLLQKFSLEKLQKANSATTLKDIYDDPVYQKALLQEASQIPRKNTIAKAMIDQIFKVNATGNEEIFGNIIGNILRTRWNYLTYQAKQTNENEQLLAKNIDTDWKDLLENRESLISTNFSNVLQVQKQGAILQGFAHLHIQELPLQIKALLENLRFLKLNKASTYEILSPLKQIIEDLANTVSDDNQLLKTCAQQIDDAIPKDWYQELSSTEKVNIVAQSVFVSLKMHGWGLLGAMGQNVLFTVGMSAVGMTAAPITLTTVAAAASAGALMYGISSAIAPMAKLAGATAKQVAQINGANKEAQANAENIATGVAQVTLTGLSWYATYFKKLPFL